MPGKTILFTLLVSFIVCLTACKKVKLEKVEALTEESELPVETARDIVYVFTDSARLKAEIRTPLMEKYTYDEPYMEMKEGLNITFFDPNHQPNGYLRADYGIRYIDKKIMEAKGNVVVVNMQGDTLNTEHLIWDEKNEKIYSDNFVRVRTADELIKSEGFESDPSFTEYKFKKIKGVINLKEEQ